MFCHTTFRYNFTHPIFNGQAVHQCTLRNSVTAKSLPPDENYLTTIWNACPTGGTKHQGCGENYDEELNDLYFSSNIVRAIKSRMRWAGRVARMGEKTVL